mgnify:CR=1 FL=1
MLTEQLIEKIKAVLDSDLTAYRVAKETGYKSANQIHNYRNGKSDIRDMKLSTAMRFERLYEEVIRAEREKL